MLRAFSKLTSLSFPWMTIKFHVRKVLFEEVLASSSYRERKTNVIDDERMSNDKKLLQLPSPLRTHPRVRVRDEAETFDG